MEDLPETTEAGGQRCDELARTLAAQRARVHDFVAAHQRRLRQAEADLARHVALIGDELARDQHQTAQSHAEATQAQAKWSAAQAELNLSQQQLESATARLRQEERELDRRRREHEADLEELSLRRQSLLQREADLERAGQALAADRHATKIQRRRIAEEFKAQRALDQKEQARRRDEWRRAEDESRNQLEELERQRSALGEARALADQRDAWLGKCAELERQLAQRTAAIDAAETTAAGDTAAMELAAERDRLLHHLAETEQRLAGTEERLTETQRRLSRAEERAAEAPSSQSALDLADMKRRYEMALDDLREARQRGAELEKKLAAAPQPSAAPAAGEGMDWEAQKRRMLASLEAHAEDDGDDEARREERLQLEDLIAKTDAALAGKEQELEAMRQLLAAAPDNAQASAACDELLSNDEIVKSERERLQRLQLEWEEKLRRAEIDLSVERAKIARERADIEERHRQLHELQARHRDEPADAADSKEKKPQRGRWLARLGLKDDETE